MARIRSNNVFGTTTDAPLTAGATTMNSAGLANLAAVTGSDEAIITLDPNRVNGAPEIVRVTAHTGSATSATIDRAEFGTSAREHPAGTEWVHGAVAGTSSDPDGDFGGFWEAYTPSNTGVTVGNGTQVARFTRIGNMVTVSYRLVFGSGTSFTGTPAFGLPVAATAAANTVLGPAWLFDAAPAQQSGICRVFGASDVRIAGDTATVSATSPWTWATGDELTFTATYEAA